MTGNSLETSAVMEFEEDVEGVAVSEIVKRVRNGFSTIYCRTLNLDHKGIGDTGVAELCGVLRKFTALEELSLVDNGITSVGVSTLCSILALCEKLTHLVLSMNSIDDIGAKRIAETLPRTNLGILWVSNNVIGRDGIRTLLLSAANSTTLTELYILGNSGVSAAVLDIVEILPHCRTLEKLVLGTYEEDLSEDFREQIRTVMQQCSNQLTVDFVFEDGTLLESILDSATFHREFLRAMERIGSIRVFRCRVSLVGDSQVGKTWTAKSLRGEPNFHPHTLAQLHSERTAAAESTALYVGNFTVGGVDLRRLSFSNLGCCDDTADRLSAMDVVSQSSATGSRDSSSAGNITYSASTEERRGKGLYKVHDKVHNFRFPASICDEYDVDAENSVCYLTLWDFGGQLMYHSWYQFFFAPGMIPCVVFDMAKLLSATVDDGATKKCPRVRAMVDQIVHYAQQSLHFGGPDCRILLVGTRADQAARLLAEGKVVESVAKSRLKENVRVDSNDGISLTDRDAPSLAQRALTAAKTMFEWIGYFAPQSPYLDGAEYSVDHVQVGNGREVCHVVETEAEWPSAQGVSNAVQPEDASATTASASTSQNSTSAVSVADNRFPTIAQRAEAAARTFDMIVAASPLALQSRYYEFHYVDDALNEGPDVILTDETTVRVCAVENDHSMKDAGVRTLWNSLVRECIRPWAREEEDERYLHHPDATVNRRKQHAFGSDMEGIRTAREFLRNNTLPRHWYAFELDLRKDATLTLRDWCSVRHLWQYAKEYHRDISNVFEFLAMLSSMASAGDVILTSSVPWRRIEDSRAVPDVFMKSLVIIRPQRLIEVGRTLLPHPYEEYMDYKSRLIASLPNIPDLAVLVDKLWQRGIVGCKLLSAVLSGTVDMNQRQLTALIELFENRQILCRIDSDDSGVQSGQWFVPSMVVFHAEHSAAGIGSVLRERRPAHIQLSMAFNWVPPGYPLLVVGALLQGVNTEPHFSLCQESGRIQFAVTYRGSASWVYIDLPGGAAGNEIIIWTPLKLKTKTYHLVQRFLTRVVEAACAACRRLRVYPYLETPFDTVERGLLLDLSVPTVPAVESSDSEPIQMISLLELCRGGADLLNECNVSATKEMYRKALADVSGMQICEDLLSGLEE